jgi:hypothetical protein
MIYGFQTGVHADNCKICYVNQCSAEQLDFELIQPDMNADAGLLTRKPTDVTSAAFVNDC